MKFLHTIRKWLTHLLVNKGRAPAKEARIGTVWFIDSVRGDDTNDGLSPGAPFLTHEKLLAAIDAASPGAQREVIICLRREGDQ